MVTLTIKAGKHYTLKLVYKDADGVIIPLTGASAVLTARKSIYSAVAFSKAAVIDEPNGIMTFTLVPADTVNLLTNTDREEYLFDVELTFNSQQQVILDGEIVLKQPITRS